MRANCDVLSDLMRSWLTYLSSAYSLYSNPISSRVAVTRLLAIHVAGRSYLVPQYVQTSPAL